MPVEKDRYPDNWSAVAYGVKQQADWRCQGCGRACRIGLPIAPVEGDMNGLRIGTPELVRWGMTSGHADRLADLIASGLAGADVADAVAEWRRSFNELHFVH